MDINVTFVGQLILFSTPLFGLICYWIAKGKVNNPFKYGVIGGVLWLLPVAGLIYLLVLVYKAPESVLNGSTQSP